MVVTARAYQTIYSGELGDVVYSDGLFVVEWHTPGDGVAPRLFVGATTASKSVSGREKAGLWAEQIADEGLPV